MFGDKHLSPNNDCARSLVCDRCRIAHVVLTRDAKVDQSLCGGATGGRDVSPSFQARERGTSVAYEKACAKTLSLCCVEIRMKFLLPLVALGFVTTACARRDPTTSQSKAEGAEDGGPVLPTAPGPILQQSASLQVKALDETSLEIALRGGPAQELWQYLCHENSGADISVNGDNKTCQLGDVRAFNVTTPPGTVFFFFSKNLFNGHWRINQDLIGLAKEPSESLFKAMQGAGFPAATTPEGGVRFTGDRVHCAHGGEDFFCTVSTRDI
jgi:hypothetical protein